VLLYPRDDLTAYVIFATSQEMLLETARLFNQSCVSGFMSCVEGLLTAG